MGGDDSGPFMTQFKRNCNPSQLRQNAGRKPVICPMELLENDFQRIVAGREIRLNQVPQKVR